MSLLLLLLLLVIISYIKSDNKNYGIYYQYNMSTSSFLTKSIEISSSSPSLQNDFNTIYYPITNNNPMIEYSQGQIEILTTILKNKTNGYYIDLAANYWRQGSNSWPLEYYYNWTGLCIEPNTIYIKGILENRRCKLITNPVYSVNNHIIKFHNDEGFGGIVEEGMDNAKPNSKRIIELETVTMNRILEEFLYPYVDKQIRKPIVLDYLSLDVEGAEFSVLQNFNFNETIFLVLSIERPKDALHEFLVRKGYWWLTQLSSAAYLFGEMFYIHYTIPSFHELMNHFRPHAITDYTLGYTRKTHYKNWFLLRPKWPPDNNINNNNNNDYNSISMFNDEDILKCSHLRQHFVYRSNKIHEIPSLEIFNMLPNHRDFSETLHVSNKLCSNLKIGIPLTKENVLLLGNNSYWKE